MLAYHLAPIIFDTNLQFSPASWAALYKMRYRHVGDSFRIRNTPWANKFYLANCIYAITCRSFLLIALNISDKCVIYMHLFLSSRISPRVNPRVIETPECRKGTYSKHNNKQGASPRTSRQYHHAGNHSDKI